MLESRGMNGGNIPAQWFITKVSPSSSHHEFLGLVSLSSSYPHILGVQSTQGTNPSVTIQDLVDESNGPRQIEDPGMTTDQLLPQLCMRRCADAEQVTNIDVPLVVRVETHERVVRHGGGLEDSDCHLKMTIDL
ncbi:hypothetical protein C1H46_016789 [Malus baccata]|uniref:Uncharacterized protein n=1 Tax=Malus baccata TaxID=106549 RepID=A0A540MFU9_MALBA|nr:hypothetical protein C1H46_016789 [Malus baccata]